VSSLHFRTIALISTTFFAFLSGCKLVQDPGGTHWILRVELDHVVEYELEHQGRSALQARAESDGFSLKSVSVQGTTLVVETSSRQAEDGIAAWVAEGSGLRIASQTPGRFELVLTDDWSNFARERVMNQMLGVLQRRVTTDPLRGIRGSGVTRQGMDRILVQIPGDQYELGRMRELLVVTGFLEFKIVQDQAPSEELLRARYSEGLPAGTMIVYERDRESDRIIHAYLVVVEADITGDYLSDANIKFDHQQRPVVRFKFSPQGGEIFSELTAVNIGQRLAIVIDDLVYSAPVIRSRITSRGQIAGRFTAQEAADLALVLRSGSFAAPVFIEEERTVGKGHVGQAGGSDDGNGRD